MAYEFDLGELESIFMDADGSHVMEFVLGVDPDEDAVVVMSVILFPTDEPDILELCFGIRIKSGPDLSVVSEPDYNSDAGKRYIPKEWRKMVLARVGNATSNMIGNILPKKVIMETFYANLPPEALTKYEAIGTRIAIWNYEIEDSFRAENGVNYWLFKKRD
jgi:hypothetical protein